MKTLNVILNLISYLFFALLVVTVFVILTSNGQFLGKFRSFLVLSGSMEPTIMTGDIIVIQQANTYDIQDVVTFKDAGDRVVTHRIMEKKVEDDTTVFKTKGDANRSADNDSVSPSSILGKVTLVIPKLGFLVGFTKTLPGFIAMILIPTVLLIIDQLLKMNKKK